MIDDGVTKDLNSESGDKAKVTAGTHADQMYFPTPDEQQLTLRALVAGCIVGGVVACTNIYIGLKIGWTFGASRCPSASR